MLEMRRREGGRWGDTQAGMIQGNKGSRNKEGERDREGRKEGWRKERREGEGEGRGEMYM